VHSGQEQRDDDDEVTNALVHESVNTQHEEQSGEMHAGATDDEATKIDIDDDTAREDGQQDDDEESLNEAKVEQQEQQSAGEVFNEAGRTWARKMMA